MQLIKGIEKVKLIDLEEGTLFEYNGTIALKSEYRNESATCECYIVGSGEMFWGNTAKPNELMVTPLILEED
jgi:hypothetical protein